MAAPWKDAQARRLLKRFRRHRDDLFTFLDDAATIPSKRSQQP
jgi:hypothetical protein